MIAGVRTSPARSCPNAAPVALVAVFEPVFQDADLRPAGRPVGPELVTGQPSSAANMVSSHHSSASTTLWGPAEDHPTGERARAAFETAARGLPSSGRGIGWTIVRVMR